jgi:aldehyde:ferredoxin oxidoreductase
MFGYMGSVLRVNLTKQRSFTEELRKDLMRKFVGGNGFGITFLFREVGRDVDPLSSENKLLFATGPLTGTPIPVAGEFGIFAKSPLTGHLGESYSSGFFAPHWKELKIFGEGIVGRRRRFCGKRRIRRTLEC